MILLSAGLEHFWPEIFREFSMEKRVLDLRDERLDWWSITERYRTKSTGTT